MFKANILAMINSRFFIDESTRGKFWRKRIRYVTYYSFGS